jgi:hypothetical protein
LGQPPRPGPTELVEETRQIVVAAMESLPAGFAVPLKVEIKTGRTWAECKLGRQLVADAIARSWLPSFDSPRFGLWHCGPGRSRISHSSTLVASLGAAAGR